MKLVIKINFSSVVKISRINISTHLAPLETAFFIQTILKK